MNENGWGLDLCIDGTESISAWRSVVAKRTVLPRKLVKRINKFGELLTATLAESIVKKI